MIFTLHFRVRDLSIHGSTPDNTADDESNTGNPQSLDPADARTDSVHNGSARRDIHATDRELEFDFSSPVRDVETLRSNMDIAIRALRVLPPRPEIVRVFVTILDCYRSAGAAILDTHGIVLRGAPRPVYGPRPRPLPRAAIFQNLDARIEQLLVAEGVVDASFPSLSSTGGNTEHIRYEEAYDNMLGTRSADDGTAASYAYRDGAEATNELRFRQGYHNGLPFG